MKNIGASVSAVLTAEKKEVEKKIVEEEYHQMRNEMVFFLLEDPTYQISAVAEWGENARGDVVVGAETYFRHILTGRRCESAWSCLVGVPEYDEHSAEMWETLCRRIEEHQKLEECIYYRKTISV